MARVRSDLPALDELHAAELDLDEKIVSLEQKKKARADAAEVFEQAEAALALAVSEETEAYSTAQEAGRQVKLRIDGLTVRPPTPPAE